VYPEREADFNQSLERAGRVADFLEFGELMIIDALARQESCGGHFNEKFETEEHEALRDDENFCHVAAWEHKGTVRIRNSTKNPWNLKTSNLRKGATSDKDD
jgi:succinate dehydrogenase / fumarate reductase flavoprotein subunit